MEAQTSSSRVLGVGGRVSGVQGLVWRLHSHMKPTVVLWIKYVLGANLEVGVQPSSLSIAMQPRVLRETQKIEIIHLVIKMRETVQIQTV